MAEKKFDREEWDRVWNYVKGLEAKISGLQNEAQPTVPVYDPTHFPLNAIEGQLALGTDGSEYKYQDGAWSIIGGGTVSGGGTIEWQDLGGPIDIHIPAVKFDTWPQSGTFLMAEATGTVSVGSSDSIVLQSTAIGGRISLITTSGGGSIYLSSNEIFLGPNRITIGVNGIGFDSQSYGFNLPRYDGTSGYLNVVGDGGTLLFRLQGASVFAANDGAVEVWSAGSFPTKCIFRVTQDGTYHILAGASWVADLT